MLEQVKRILGQPLDNNSGDDDDCDMYVTYDMDCNKGLEKLRGSVLNSKLFVIASPPIESVNKYYEKSIERMIVTTSSKDDLIVDISPESVTMSGSISTTSVVLSVSLRLGRKVVRFVSPHCDDGDDDDDNTVNLSVEQSSKNAKYVWNASTGKMTINQGSILDNRLKTSTTLNSDLSKSCLGKRTRIHDKFPTTPCDSIITVETATTTFALTPQYAKSKYFISRNSNNSSKIKPTGKRFMPLDIIVSC